MVHQDQQGVQVHRVHRGREEREVPQDHLEVLDQRDHLGQEDPLAQLVREVNQDHKDPVVKQESVAREDHLDNLDSLEKGENLDLQDQLVQLDLWVQLVKEV